MTPWHCRHPPDVCTNRGNRTQPRAAQPMLLPARPMLLPVNEEGDTALWSAMVEMGVPGARGPHPLQPAIGCGHPVAVDARASSPAPTRRSGGSPAAVAALHCASSPARTWRRRRVPVAVAGLQQGLQPTPGSAGAAATAGATAPRRRPTRPAAGATRPAAGPRRLPGCAAAAAATLAG